MYRNGQPHHLAKMARDIAFRDFPSGFARETSETAPPRRSDDIP
jgi:hypothetical protein